MLSQFLRRARERIAHEETGHASKRIAGANEVFTRADLLQVHLQHDTVLAQVTKALTAPAKVTQSVAHTDNAFLEKGIEPVLVGQLQGFISQNLGVVVCGCRVELPRLASGQLSQQLILIASRHGVSLRHCIARLSQLANRVFGMDGEHLAGAVILGRHLAPGVFARWRVGQEGGKQPLVAVGKIGDLVGCCFRLYRLQRCQRLRLEVQIKLDVAANQLINADIAQLGTLPQIGKAERLLCALAAGILFGDVPVAGALEIVQVGRGVVALTVLLVGLGHAFNQLGEHFGLVDEEAPLLALHGIGDGLELPAAEELADAVQCRHALLDAVLLTVLDRLQIALFSLQPGHLNLSGQPVKLALQALNLTAQAGNVLQAIGTARIHPRKGRAILGRQLHDAPANLTNSQIATALRRHHNGDVLLVQQPLPANQLVGRQDLAWRRIGIVEVDRNSLAVAQLEQRHHIGGTVLLEGVGYLGRFYAQALNGTRHHLLQLAHLALQFGIGRHQGIQRNQLLAIGKLRHRHAVKQQAVIGATHLVQQLIKANAERHGLLVPIYGGGHARISLDEGGTA